MTEVTHELYLKWLRQQAWPAMMIGRKFGENDLYSGEGNSRAASHIPFTTGAIFKHLDIETMMYFY